MVPGFLVTVGSSLDDMPVGFYLSREEADLKAKSLLTKPLAAINGTSDIHKRDASWASNIAIWSFGPDGLLYYESVYDEDSDGFGSEEVWPIDNTDRHMVQVGLSSQAAPEEVDFGTDTTN